MVIIHTHPCLLFHTAAAYNEQFSNCKNVTNDCHVCILHSCKRIGAGCTGACEAIDSLYQLMLKQGMQKLTTNYT